MINSITEMKKDLRMLNIVPE